MQNFRDLKVWQKSHQLTLDVYKLSAKYPREETFNLVSQIKRSSSSIPTNIAEGCGRKSDKDFSRFLYISFGSANELEYQMLLSKDLDFISAEDYEKIQLQTEEIKKMLSALIKTLNVS